MPDQKTIVASLTTRTPVKNIALIWHDLVKPAHLQNKSRFAAL
jgi:hypothetical protein